MIISINSTSIFGLITSVPIGLSVNPLSKRRTILGIFGLRNNTVSKQPNPRAKYKAYIPWLFCALLAAI